MSYNAQGSHTHKSSWKCQVEIPCNLSQSLVSLKSQGDGYLGVGFGEGGQRYLNMGVERGFGRQSSYFTILKEQVLPQFNKWGNWSTKKLHEL